MDNRQQLGAVESGDAPTGQDRGNHGRKSPTIVESSPQSVTGRSDKVEVTGVMQNENGLRTLYSIADSTDAGEQPTVDILAIHGLGAAPDYTWGQKVKHSDGKESFVNWLSDANMLPQKFPRARIMRYGYESDWFGDGIIRQRVPDVADRLLPSLKREREFCINRPLIFVAHCFGGLVILQTMLSAQRDASRWMGIFDSTVGIVFLGTPFRGTRGLTDSEMLRRIQSHYRKDQIQQDNLRILELGNESLTKLLDDFCQYTRKERNIARLACFYEQKPTNVAALYKGAERLEFVVDETSGCLDTTASTDKYSFSRDHFSMNKFAKSTEEDFMRLCEVLKEMEDDAHALISARNQKGGSFRVNFNLTGVPAIDCFVDREEEMTQIRATLHAVKDRRKIHILYGLGGSGKTQLACEYARKYRDMYDAILWLNGNSKDTLLQSLAAFATKLNSAESTMGRTSGTPNAAVEANATLTWLALKENRKWLLIIDNVDREYQLGSKDPQAYDPLSFFWPADHGSFLITTRLQSLREIGSSTEIGRMNPIQGLELLCDRQGWSPSSRDIEADMEKLNKRLGYLALAIVQAGKYMQKTGTSCRKYLALYETSWSKLLAEIPQLRGYENGSIQTTWMISYEHIREANPTAVKFLELWAYLDHQDVWYELFSRYNNIVPEHSWLRELIESEIFFKNVMGALLDYSLVESHRQNDSYSIHPVVQDWCTESIGSGQVHMVILAFTIVGFAVPSDSEPQYWLAQRRLLPHADRCLRYLPEPVALNEIFLDGLEGPFDELGKLYRYQGKLPEAEKMFERAAYIGVKVLGLEHKDTLYFFEHLAMTYQDQGKLAEAEDLYQGLIDENEEVLGHEPSFTLDILNSLGDVYLTQGKLVEAEEKYQQASNWIEKTLGLEYSSILHTINSLGNLYSEQGKLVEAEEMLQRALIGYQEVYGPEDLATLRNIGNLGTIYKKQGKRVEAENLYQQALSEYKKRSYEDKSIPILKIINNLGFLYIEQGKLVEAEKMFEQALSGYDKWGHEDKNVSILTELNNLGNLYLEQGKLVEAEKMYQRVFDEYEKVLGPEHESILETVDNVGALYQAQGRLVEAEKMYQRALSGYEKVSGHEDRTIYILRLLGNLGTVYSDQGKLVEAEKMYQRSLDGLKSVMGPEHGSTLWIANNLRLLHEKTNASSPTYSN